MEALLGIFKYLKNISSSNWSWITDYVTWSSSITRTAGNDITPARNSTELPLALGNLVQMTFFVDAAFATDLIETINNWHHYICQRSADSDDRLQSRQVPTAVGSLLCG
jgi:hypothetical protein